jgi:periplasmic mercuric ion binding protein
MKPASLLIAAALLASSLTAQASTIEMKVYGMVCGFCAQGIEKSLRKNPATADVVVNLENKLVVVTTREGQDIADDELRKLITSAGYDVKEIARTQRTMSEVRGQIAQAKE